ncbi:hypothetical protein ACWD7C_06495 [Streptomyces sp. NPDC005134]|uniref:hypothetical protein n=1 Tax=Streptomyces sp. NPDC005098 TaxID=3154560 RepID=UPI0033AC394A
MSGMRQSCLGRIVESAYGGLPARKFWLNRAVNLDGGAMTSVMLRQVVARFHGVEFGNYSYGSMCWPGASDRGTIIGVHVSIGPGVRRFDASHPMDQASMRPYLCGQKLGYVGSEHAVARSECFIGHESWIGANSVILSGCTRIGIGAVVGAGSVVTQDVDDFAVVVGNPVRLVRQRLSAAERKTVLESRRWELDPAGYVMRDPLASRGDLACLVGRVDRGGSAAHK